MLTLCLFAVFQVLSYHIPFLVSSIEDFKDHIPRETDMKVAPVWCVVYSARLKLPGRSEACGGGVWKINNKIKNVADLKIACMPV